MTQEDRRRWDERYARQGAPRGAAEPPDFVAAHADLLPTAGAALDLACGPGRAAVWLARRGLDVLGVDVSATAIDQARKLAQDNGISDRCRFDVVDLDDGVPPGPPAAVILCNLFRDRRLDRQIVDRLAPGGVLAIATLSQVGGRPGPFRATPGELSAAFADLEILASDESDGRAWLLARA
ncbi:bifunctional 2-polyprenyl-6-hydroxyphenol methylase/3-demethylubiquinol 3-O-methyltransferase UbiG [Mycobacterium sp. 1423905.2]|uniref:class I SAM-dependent methyltransferase n=1 Tax=Mycobacterium sp. 1423905.2 TaxID=1856859 RepID=UPI0008000528|nr:class I SAM-dependent methyltransferase [Mycobacterium sp. 1423905.2]OBJ61145.1 SAM-dependent methyltransferase [Mycobacterium sp. 1423905.2]